MPIAEKTSLTPVIAKISLIPCYAVEIDGNIRLGKFLVEAEGENWVRLLNAEGTTITVELSNRVPIPASVLKIFGGDMPSERAMEVYGIVRQTTYPVNQAL